MTPIPNFVYRAGIAEALEAQGFVLACVGGVWSTTGDTTACSAAAATYDPLAYNKAQKQIALDALLDNNFDLKAFIRAGASSTVTAANVGSFLAVITNNYRSLRAAIASAANQSALDAVNLNAGWPSNP